MNSGGRARWTDGTIPLVEPECLTSLIAATSDLAFVISGEGLIHSVLLDHRSQDHSRLSSWTGRPMRDFLTAESLPKFIHALETTLAGHDTEHQIDLSHNDGDIWQHPIRYSFHKIGQARLVLMRGSDHWRVARQVGSTTLREILAKSSDEIEKRCIETAVEMTRNNRAAAAEMLGMSRQSLYVKLRKYGLLKREQF